MVNLRSFKDEVFFVVVFVVVDVVFVVVDMSFVVVVVVVDGNEIQL